MKTIIIGHSGRMAQAFKKYMPDPERFSVRMDNPLTYETLKQDIKNKVDRGGVSAIINCAAFTNVDDAEFMKAECQIVNVNLPNMLVNIAEHFDLPLVHFSTDFVYGDLPTDNRLRKRVLSEGYMVHDLPNPISYYGTSKHISELIVRNYKKGLVCRVCGIYSHYKPDYLSMFLKQVSLTNDPQSELKIAAEGYCNPTAADDIAQAVTIMLGKGLVGLYHVVSPEPASMLDFLRTALLMYGAEHAVQSIRLVPLSEIKQRVDLAPRPIYSVLGTGELASRGVILPNWRQSLWQYMEEQRRLVEEALDEQKLPRNISPDSMEQT